MRKFLLISCFFLLSAIGFTQCENYTVQIFSYVLNGGPTSVTWEIEDLENNNIIPGGTVTFSSFTFQQTITVCLEPGCYNLDLEANAVLSQNNFVATVMSGETILYPTNVLEYGGDALNYNFCTGVEEPTCVACFTPQVSEGVLTINNCSTPVDPENTTFTWTFGDGSNGDGPMPVHTYTENGVYEVCVVMVVTIDNIISCISDYCAPVVVEGLTASECPTAIWSGPQGDCGVMNFEIGSFVEGEAVTWFPGDESGAVEGGHFFQHAYEQPGLYTVCAYYTSPLCPDGVELCTQIFIESCGNDCPQEIIGTQIDCDSYFFQIPGTAGEVSWSFGDDTFENSGNSADHTFQEDGVYIVTANYFSELCGEGITLTYTVVLNCGNICPTDIVATYNCELGTTTLTVDGLNEDAMINWWWNGNEEFTEGPSITLENTNSNIFICAWSDSLQTEGCPEVCEEVFIGCESNCNLNINMEQEDCELIVLSASGVPNPENVVWLLNGEVFNTGNLTTFWLEQGVSYQICAIYESEECSDEWCETYVGCDGCNWASTVYYSNPMEGGPVELTCVLFNSDNVAIEEVEIFFSDEILFSEYLNCYSSGCYTLHVCSPEPFNAEAFEITFPQGWEVVSVTSLNNFLCYGYDIVLSLNGDCGEVECTEVVLGIDSYQINGGAHYITWFVYDELENLVADGMHEYTNENSYYDAPVCLPDGCYTVVIQDQTTGEFSYETLFTFATANGQPLTITQPLLIDGQFASFGFALNSDCGVVECQDNEVTLLITSTYAEAGSDMFNMTLNYENFPLQYEGFQLCSECPEELAYTFCVADGCYEIDLETSFPLSAESILFEAFVNGVDIPVALLEMVQGSEGGSFVIGVNTDCEDSVEESQKMEWELYPNPTENVLNISRDNTEPALIRILDMTGRIVLESSITSYGKQLDIASLSSGVYSVVSSTDNARSSKVLEVVK